MPAIHVIGRAITIGWPEALGSITPLTKCWKK
jgi:hypothetical protein